MGLYEIHCDCFEIYLVLFNNFVIGLCVTETLES